MGIHFINGTKKLINLHRLTMEETTFKERTVQFYHPIWGATFWPEFSAELSFEVLENIKNLI